MSQTWFHDFAFRGDRVYVHSASLCNHLRARFGEITEFDITFKTWMAARVVFRLGEAETGLAAKGSFRFRGETGEMIEGSFTDDPAFPTTRHEPYDEEGLVAGARLSDRLLSCDARAEGSFFDRLIAANKVLINRALQPGVKLIAARITLAQLAADGCDFQLRLESHLGSRLFRSSCLRQGQKTGEVIFYGQ